ncbi:MAG: DUF2384 domain-containing protein [Candidatus Cloacimonetes bacterium]|nr:DUF2384 domain-containing protein [Candidatus Cloacimonadota bacterium]
MGLFRSRATGTYRHNSDIDTVIYGDITEADEALVLSKAWQLAVILLRVYRGLDAYMGGHKENVKLWLVAKNDALGGVPVELMGTVEGLVGVVQYLDAMRGP